MSKNRPAKAMTDDQPMGGRKFAALLNDISEPAAKKLFKALGKRLGILA